MNKYLSFVTGNNRIKQRKSSSNDNQANTENGSNQHSQVDFHIVADMISADIYRTNQELNEMERRRKERRALNGKPTFHEIDL